MEALKAAVGLGKKEQSGQEPISGMKVTGTAAEPYDSGNQEDSTGIPGQSSVEDKVAGATDSTTTSGKSEEPAASHTVPEAASASYPAANESETSKAFSSSGGGDQAFGSSSQSNPAIPFRERQDDVGAGHSVPPQATAGAGDHGAVTESSERQSGLPPNHLGANVPAEIGTGPVDTSQTNQPTSKGTMTPSHAAPPAHIGEAAMYDTTPAPSTAHPQLSTADQGVKTAAEHPQQYIAETHPASQQQQQTAPSTSTGGALFSNPFSSGTNKSLDTDSPASSLEKRRLSREAYGSNPNAIPTAGGKRVGSVAYEQRRSMSLSQPSVSEVREEGEGRGGMAVVDEGGGVVTGMSGVSEASEVQRAPETMAAGTEWGVPTNFTPFSPGAAAGVESDEPAPRASLSPPGEGGEPSKRKGIFDKVKEKLPGHHKEH
ncbi:hypothetical protein LTR35_000950 [Friedmanniomyces endolithicus]|uniref:Uncharacterized protein n=1 Tax=Friedmanniomyces endolithicus TaxID=329885 RepID=A0AAN6JAZ5_9PEZI|nr:hypothetical protein LTS00_011166 [Friedmanniomyces endolithicus]KAK0292919.1 hypothetical protein LTR35_000950 [Friedmanniomyces endolithicus]KAK0323430.1 hypothetical protein LTR82_005790 [Friedmanniomyces endolithicus]KAK1013432.1 hypothetical protein LTR54_004339 [Friedmanniomyces endolithicus]